MTTTRVAYRFGDVVLDVETSYAPLLEELESAYGDCATGQTEMSGPHIRCTALFIESHSLLAITLDVPTVIPHLRDAAHAILRPRIELQHFVARDSDLADWKLIANERDEQTPLMIASSNVALIDVRNAPYEFVINFLVGVAQLAQPATMFIHGGAVSIDGRGTLITGRSGRGKSTTTAALASRGHAFLGDETIGVHSERIELTPFRRTLKLRPGPRAVAMNAKLEIAQRGRRIDAAGVECDWVRPSALFTEPPPASVPFTDVFFLRDFRDAAATERFTPSLEHVEELQALPMTMSAIVSWPSSPAHRLLRFMRVIDVFAKCRCHFLDLGTPDETAALIERTVRECD